MYSIKKNVEKVLSGNSTYFVDLRDFKLITSKLSKYSVYYPYHDCSKVIIYDKVPAEVVLHEIKSSIPLRHQEILGTMFSLNVSSEMFGDIVVYENRYFIFLTKVIENYVLANFSCINNIPISLEKVDIHYLDDYRQSYEEISAVVSSLRIDTVASKIIKTNRKVILDKIKNKDVLVNYDFVTKPTYVLRENDVFSIRKYGKYKFMGVAVETKKNNYVVRVFKYI